MYSVPPSRISFSVCRLTLLLRLASRSKHSLKTSISPVAASTVVNVAIDVVSGGCCSTSLSRQLGGGGCNNSSKVVWCQWVVGNRGLRADTAARIGGSFSAADSASSSDFTALTNGGRPPSLVLAPSKNNSSCNKIVRFDRGWAGAFFSFHAIAIAARCKKVLRADGTPCCRCQPGNPIGWNRSLVPDGAPRCQCQPRNPIGCNRSLVLVHDGAPRCLCQPDTVS